GLFVDAGFLGGLHGHQPADHLLLDLLAQLGRILRPLFHQQADEIVELLLSNGLAVDRGDILGVGRNGDDAACGKQGEFFHGYLYQVLLVTMARAWMGWGMRSCTRSYTRRCRASAPRPANRGEAMTTRKWLAPSRAPAWPACRCDSSMISRLDGSSAASRSR